jgi:hypothetical protein
MLSRRPPEGAQGDLRPVYWERERPLRYSGRMASHKRSQSTERSLHAFPRGVSEKVGFYVYALLDPQLQPPKPFYVGKGCGNRVFAHARAALRSPRRSDKLDRIREIMRADKTVQVQIIRHGLDARAALEVEAATIDILTEHDLANEVAGHGHGRGLMTVEEFVEVHAAPSLQITDPVVLIRIARKWQRGMSSDALYEAARRSWRVSSSRVQRARYAVAVADGIVREVYGGVRWIPARRGSKDRRRWLFTGQPAVDRASWIGCSVASYLPNGNQNPIRYVRC